MDILLVVIASFLVILGYTANIGMALSIESDKESRPTSRALRIAIAISLLFPYATPILVAIIVLVGVFIIYLTD